MDISSYPLEEAKEYIRNLARLRMNLIVFHSYTGHFYDCPELKLQAGAFFYGQRHDLPSTPLFQLRMLRNCRTYCIPEIEAIFDRKQERSEAAIAWLAAVMHQVRIRAHWPFNSPSNFPRPIPTTAWPSAGLSGPAYPQIGTLELISPENAGKPEDTLARNLAIAAKLRRIAGQNAHSLSWAFMKRALLGRRG